MAGRMLALCGLIIIICLVLSSRDAQLPRGSSPLKIEFTHPAIAVVKAPSIQKIKTERAVASVNKKSSTNRIPSKSLSVRESSLYSLERLQYFADRDDLCSVLRFSDIPGPDVGFVLSRISTGNIGEDLIVDALLDVSTGPFDGNTNSPDTSVVGDFFRALLLSDQVEGASAAETDLGRARLLLESLARRDPENAIHPLFLAGVALLDGKPDVEIKNFLKEAFRRNRFDSFSGLVGRNIEQRGFRNPTYNYLVYHYLQRMPAVKYAPIYQKMREYIESNEPGFAEGATKLCQSIVDAAEKEKVGDDEAYTMALDAGFGSRCLRKLNKGPSVISSHQGFVDRTRIGREYESLKQAWKTRKTNCDRKKYDEISLENRTSMKW